MKPKPKQVEKNNIKKKTKKIVKNKRKKDNLIDFKWVGTITILAFFISLCFSAVSQSIIPNVQIIISIVLVLLVILIGVIFDMVGIAVTVADPKVFHAMSAKKVKSAKIALKLIKNAPKVSSLCNDVIGDICGIISGSGGAAISTILALKLGVSALMPSLLITALIASLTIGGKALGKGIAVSKANYIIDKFSKILAIFKKKS